jgi:hypothetical protein
MKTVNALSVQSTIEELEPELVSISASDLVEYATIWNNSAKK